MTFYWWSHWFWITLLSTFLLPILFVHTYPSHDIALEYKNDNNNNNNNDDDKNSKAVTKLYQTTTKIIWATTLPPINSEADESIAPARTKLTNIPITLEQAADATATETDADNLQLAAVEAADRSDSVDYEFKRSTDENKSNKTDGTIPQLAAEHQPQERQNDESSLLDQISLEHSLNSSRQEKELKDFSSNHNSSNFSSTTTSKTETMKITAVQNGSPTLSSASSSSTPSQPQINVNNAHSPVEWLNSRTLATPDHVADEEETSSASDGEKVPFTLENVNKEDEILRAENEHRSRKSKVLSAEYNHINRFINFSTDSKNLLTRSASSAPNDYDGDDGNISSEALAIKRTYFLDASAISAICFTVFGVCCTVGTLGIVLYRRRFLNKPQALSEPDSSVYIDDSTMRVSDNSDEMYSLDNDSFLNSLEAMTIQNYWTDTVKHTKL